MTGEAGTGKTLLVKRVIEGIPSTVAPLLLRDPRVSFEEFVEFACKQFNLEQLVVKVETPFEDRVEVLQRYLVGQQRQGRAVVVLIDDAEVMTEALLSIRHLQEMREIRQGRTSCTRADLFRCSLGGSALR